MNDYPKMLYLGAARTPFLAHSEDHEALLRDAMSRTDPATDPEPDHDPESDAPTPRRKKAHK